MPADWSPRERGEDPRTGAPAHRAADRRHARPRPCRTWSFRPSMVPRSRVAAENADLACPFAHLPDRVADLGVPRMAVEHHVESVTERRLRDRARHELHKVQTVAMEWAECVIQRARLMVGD